MTKQKLWELERITNKLEDLHLVIYRRSDRSDIINYCVNVRYHIYDAKKI